MQKIKIKVKARSKMQKVEKMPDGSMKVWVKEAPEKGRANVAVIEALSRYLGKPKRLITITSGHTSSNKTIEL